MSEVSNTKRWWKSIQGILTATAGIITAATGLIVVISQFGGNGEDSAIQNSPTTELPVNATPEHPSQQTTDGWTIIGKFKNGRFFDLNLMVHGDSPAIGRRYDAVEDFRLVSKRPKKDEDQGQVITLGMVRRGDSVEVLDLFTATPSTETVAVWAKLRTVLHDR